MAALEMSNGQITHHLKILEDEGRIWRRADGRLVRFYPYTSNSHPGVLDQDLPMPPLSPDPNSLQGKILRLLDDDGQMKQFPTQARIGTQIEQISTIGQPPFENTTKIRSGPETKVWPKEQILSD